MSSNSGDVIAIASPFIFGLTISADAAVGAAAGSAFFLMSQVHHPLADRVVYAVISMMVGYAAGIAATAPWTMLVSATASALAVVTLASAAKSITDGEVGGALRFIVDLWRGRK